jgi:sulfur relay (sulfurtransferase) DsrC/TusE family protein
MPHLEFEGKQYEVDEDGYLQDWQDGRKDGSDNGISG